MTGSDQVGEGSLPLVAGEILGMSVAGPLTFEDDLVLGLVTGLARLHYGGGGHGTLVFTDLVGQSWGRKN